MQLPDVVREKLPEGSKLREALEHGEKDAPIAGAVYLKLNLPDYPQEYFNHSEPPAPVRQSLLLSILPRKKSAITPPAEDVHDERLVIRMEERNRIRGPVVTQLKEITHQEITHPADASIISLTNPTVGQMIDAIALPGIATASNSYRDVDDALRAKAEQAGVQRQ